MTSHVRSGQLEEALELSKELLGPGGLLAGTDPSENYRILLGRADALAQLSFAPYFGVGRAASASRHSTSGADRFVVISSSSPYPWPYP